MTTTTTTSVSREGSRVRAMFDSIAPSYDKMNTLLSGGLHHVWKRRFVAAIPQAKRALDLATGTGDLLPLLAKQCETVVGADFSAEMLASGGRGDRFQLVVADAMNLPFADAAFDVVTISFGVRNFEDLGKGLREARRVLSPETGTLHILEFGQPANPFWRAIFQTFSQKVMPVVGGLIARNKAAYAYLPATSATFPCGDEFANILRAQGFDVYETMPVFGGVAYIYRAHKDSRSPKK